MYGESGFWDPRSGVLGPWARRGPEPLDSLNNIREIRGSGTPDLGSWDPGSRTLDMGPRTPDSLNNVRGSGVLDQGPGMQKGVQK